MRFASLWNGPPISDHVESIPPGSGIAYSFTLGSCGLYALDSEGRAWTYCDRIYTGKFRWVLVEDLMSGAAGRAVVAAEKAERGET